MSPHHRSRHSAGPTSAEVRRRSRWTRPRQEPEFQQFSENPTIATMDHVDQSGLLSLPCLIPPWVQSWILSCVRIVCLFIIIMLSAVGENPGLKLRTSCCVNLSIHLILTSPPNWRQRIFNIYKLPLWHLGVSLWINLWSLSSCKATMHLLCPFGWLLWFMPLAL